MTGINAPEKYRLRLWNHECNKYYKCKQCVLQMTYGLGNYGAHKCDLSDIYYLYVI